MLTLARYGTRDVARAREFYDAIAAVTGATRVMDYPGVIAYKGPSGGMFMIGTPFEGEANAGNGTQVGFAVESSDIVDAAHAKAMELGGKCAGAPGPRGEDGVFYAAYFRDRDGNKVMVFRTAPGFD